MAVIFWNLDWSNTDQCNQNIFTNDLPILEKYVQCHKINHAIQKNPKRFDISKFPFIHKNKYLTLFCSAIIENFLQL